jgi:Asp-tRNA(Asn)/Glu-tRNA(Gln) amidotransferase A subunit family amidase
LTPGEAEAERCGRIHDNREGCGTRSALLALALGLARLAPPGQARANPRALRAVPSADLAALDPTRGPNLVARIHQRMVFGTLYAFDSQLKSRLASMSVVDESTFAMMLNQRFDLIATPTMLAPPAALDAGGSVASPFHAEWAAPLHPFNLTGHPAASVPVGFGAEGTPIGLQLIGPWHGEAPILAAAAPEQALGWAGKWPAR